MTLTSSWKTALMGLAIWLICLVGNASPARCKVPSSEKIDSVRRYVAELEDVGAEQDLKLVDNAQAGKSCFWKLHFESTVKRKEITVYLSPDMQYLAPNVYDLSSDPLAEQRSSERQAMKVLTDGNPPVRGPVAAETTIVEFVDFECPFCLRLTDVLEKQALWHNSWVKKRTTDEAAARKSTKAIVGPAAREMPQVRRDFQRPGC